MAGSNGNGDGHGYGGDEEPTPAQPGVRISVEARSFASLALEFNHASAVCWSASRLLDATEGDNRFALIGKLVTELNALIAATTAARAALIKQQAEVVR